MYKAAAGKLFKQKVRIGKVISSIAKEYDCWNMCKQMAKSGKVLSHKLAKRCKKISFFVARISVAKRHSGV